MNVTHMSFKKYIDLSMNYRKQKKEEEGFDKSPTFHFEISKDNSSSSKMDEDILEKE